MNWWQILILVITSAIATGVLGFILGGLNRKRVAENAIGSATKEAKRIVNDALSQAETSKKESILEAKDEIHKQRAEVERELRERRGELQRQERRLVQKEESLDKKTDNLEKKEEILEGKVKVAEDRLIEVDSIKRSQFEMQIGRAHV